jgi:transposase InsO family protein
VRLHGNAKLVPSSRRLLVARVLEEHWKIHDAAVAFGISERTAYRWLGRWRGGDHELVDRSSVPRRVPRRTPRRVVALIERLRRLRFTSTRIAAELRMAVSTVGAVLARLGLNRLSRLEPPEPPNRYCRRHAGELVHLDIKQLGRFDRPGHRVTGRRGRGFDSRHAGWEYAHVAVDDCTRLAYVEILDDQRRASATGFLRRVVAWFRERGVKVREVMTDNGSCYISGDFAASCEELRLRHLRTQPNRPRTNGKAERFIQTMLREWAYAATYQTNKQRAVALRPWLDYYNHRRPHGALGHQPPASRLCAA